MHETVERGKRAMRADLVARDHTLNERQSMALNFLLDHGSLAIQDYEALCPDTHRRTLQRDLKRLVEKGVFDVEGATNRLRYRLGKGIEA